jgi:hypothetical protein
MDKQIRLKLILAPFLFFVVVNCTSLSLGRWLDGNHIDSLVLIYANGLLFALTVVALFMNIKALANKNPHVFVRSVMAGTFIKLMAILAAVMIYVVAAGKNRSIGAVLVGMALYIVYTVFEVRASLQLNRVKDGSN